MYSLMYRVQCLELIMFYGHAVKFFLIRRWEKLEFPGHGDVDGV